MDDGFVRLDGRIDRLDQKMDDGFARIDSSFARIDSRLDGLKHVLVQSVWTFGIGLLGFAGALLAIIAEK